MATRTRDPAPGTGRDKTRGTSPSSNTPHMPQQRRPSPNPSSSKRVSPARPHDSDHKPNLPNYLKPTISSRLDGSKQPVSGKKPVSGSDSTLQKPTLTRRRSFDKPTPPASRTQKTRVSPNPTVRSSSFSGKTIGTTSQKQSGPTDKNSKAGAKDGAAGSKQRTTSLYAKPAAAHVKKSSSSTMYVVKKQDTTNTSAADKHHQAVISTDQEKVDTTTANITDVHEEPPTQPHEENDSSSTTENEEQMVQVGTIKNEEVSEEFKTKDQESELISGETEAAEIIDKEVSKIVEVEPSTVSEQHDDFVASKKPEEPFEDKPQIEAENGCNKLREIEERTMHEISNFTDESVAANPNAELKEIKEGDEGTVKVEAASGITEARDESKETSEQAAVEEKKEAEASAPLKQQVTQGKKLDSAVSNDVIEETASKLREQRKNKVKALAGAFETVISLQEPK